MANAENNALANTIDTITQYLADPNNLYGVLRASLKTTALETRFVNFIGAKFISYPVFPLSTTDMPTYSKTKGYEILNEDYDRKVLECTQDNGYQERIDAIDLNDSGLTAVSIINNRVRQMEVPSIDKYRLATLVGATGVGVKNSINLTSMDPFDLYDEACESLINNEIPLEGTVLYVTPDFYKAMKSSDRLRRTVNANTNDGRVNNNIYLIDDVTEVVVVPTTRMPANVKFILVQPLCVVSTIKRNVTYVKYEPEDYDGIMINRRLVHDLFVLEDRAKGIYYGTTAAE